MKSESKAVLTVEEVQKAASALNALHATMAFLRPLTAPERRQFGQMGSSKVRVTARRLEAARKHRDALPPAFDLEEFERDTALLVALNDCLTAAARIQSEVRDTLLVLGSATVQTGRQAVAVIEAMAAASDKLGHTVTSLKSRKPTRRIQGGVSAEVSAEPPVPPPKPDSVPVQAPPVSPSTDGQKAA